MTAEELFRTGDIGPCELVHGELRRLSPGSARHGVVAARVLARLGEYADERGGAVFLVVGIVLARDPDTVRAPDIAYVRAERTHLVPDDGYLTVPPDLAVEVLSPDDRRSDVEEKIADWLAMGVPMAWLVDIDARAITVQRPGAASRIVASGGTVGGEDVMPGFTLPVEVFFER